MNCSVFESELTALAAGDVAEDLRGPALERLRLHATDCEACRGTLDLLDLLALPPGERDLAEDPGPEYWATFDGRLAARIAAVEAAPAERSHQPRWWAAAAAAVVLIGLIGGSVWFRSGAPDETTELAWLMAENMTHELSEEPVELPGDLAAMLEGLSAEQAADALSGLAGLEAPWDGQEWAQPDDEAFDALLGDVNDLDQLALLEDWLPAAGALSLSAEAGLAGITSGTLTPFPDARGLDGNARKELLKWLSEQDVPSAGVS